MMLDNILILDTQAYLRKLGKSKLCNDPYSSTYFFQMSLFGIKVPSKFKVCVVDEIIKGISKRAELINIFLMENDSDDNYIMRKLRIGETSIRGDVKFTSEGRLSRWVMSPTVANLEAQL